MKTHRPLSHVTFLCAALLAPLSLTAQEQDSSRPGIELVNASSRVVITSDAPSSITGFVLDGANGSDAKRWVLIRAVGPSLADIGVENPLVQPAANLQRQDAEPTPLGYEHHVFPQIIYPDGSTPETRFRAALHRATEASGASPVPIPEVGEPVPESHDIVDLVELSPGAYTVQAVSAAADETGTVVVEIFVLPRDFDPQLKPEGVESPDTPQP
jgi:hypothetical protein